MKKTVKEVQDYVYKIKFPKSRKHYRTNLKEKVIVKLKDAIQDSEQGLCLESFKRSS